MILSLLQSSVSSVLGGMKEVTDASPEIDLKILQSLLPLTTNFHVVTGDVLAEVLCPIQALETLWSFVSTISFSVFYFLFFVSFFLAGSHYLLQASRVQASSCQRNSSCYCPSDCCFSL